MRYLTAILGVLAMIATLSGPVAALTAVAPCDQAAMAKMVPASDMGPCKPATKACAEPCLAPGLCQSNCGSALLFIKVDPEDSIASLLKVKLTVEASEQPPGTASPVDGPPPKL